MAAICLGLNVLIAVLVFENRTIPKGRTPLGLAEIDKRNHI